MPARNPELPEGTDHIINGAMETGAGTTGSTGSSGGTATGGEGPGFIGAGGDDTGGTTLGSGVSVTMGSGDPAATGTSGGAGFGGGAGIGGGGGAAGGGSFGDGGDMGGTSAGGAGGAPVKQQLREGVDSVRQQAGDRVRAYALTGKDKATTALQDLSQVVNDAAAQIDDRLGAQYGDYARRAADAVTGLADTLRNKEVDELFDDAREIVRKSPGVAIGAAAIVGFTLVRLVKAGLDSDGMSGGPGSGSSGSTGGNVDFRAEGGSNIDFQPDRGIGGSTTGTGL